MYVSKDKVLLLFYLVTMVFIAKCNFRNANGISNNHPGWYHSLLNLYNLLA